MRQYLIVGGGLLGAIAALGWWGWDRGTTVAFERCLERAKDSSLNAYTQRKICLDRTERPIAVKIEGRASFSRLVFLDLVDEEVFKGHAMNQSSDYVVTRFTVTVYAKNNPSDSATYTVKGMWLEPKQSQDFKTWIKPSAVTGPTQWRISDVHGLKISF